MLFIFYFCLPGHGSIHTLGFLDHCLEGRGLLLLATLQKSDRSNLFIFDLFLLLVHLFVLSPIFFTAVIFDY